MAHEVFICYATRDKAVANAVCDALESRNIKCWIAPRDVLIGTEWAESIVDALDESRILVLVLSSNSNTSPQVIREVGRAASNGTPIIPLRIDDVVPSKAMDYFVSSHQWLDAQAGPLEKHLQRLTDVVQQILARRRAPGEVVEIAEAEEAAEKAKREEEARKAKEAEERARREAEEKAWREAEEAKEKAKREAEEARKAKEAEEKATREAEEARKAKEAEEKAKREAELAAKEREKREAEEAKEKAKAKREAEEARKAKEAAQPAIYCPKCGIELRPDVSFCPRCGASVSRAAKAKEAKRRRAKPAKAWVSLLKRRWWLWGGVGAVVVALVLVLVLVLPSSETPLVSPPGEEEEEQPAEEEEEEEVTPTPVVAEEPEYGGTLVFRASFIDVITDPLDPRAPQFGSWLEALFTDDMTADRDEFGFLCSFFPVEYRAGQLAEGWEQSDPTTVVVYLRQGVVWKGGPAEGREFTSDDVVYTYDKVLGVGEFAGEDPNSIFSGVIPSVTECVAIDRYTVKFHFDSSGPFKIYELVNPWMSIPIVPREWYDDLTGEEQADWHNVVGTGPFILTDYVAGTSMTCAKNSAYYGVDARYPVNQLPYADELKILVIPDMASALTALRTGQIDILADARVYPTFAEAQMLAETNPEIVQFLWPTTGPGLFFHWNQNTGTITPPFDDIRVRKAMQLAIDNVSIAGSLYQGTVDPDPCGLMSPLASDWDFSFDEWPAELQAEYGYDLEEAKSLMAEAGFAGGFDTEILAVSTDFPEVLEIIQSQFEKIGINMTINSMDMMEQRPIVQEGDFELLWTSITGSTNSSPVDAIQSFYSKKFERFGQGGGVIDAAYDAIVEDFMAATTEAEAQAIFQEADKYWLEKHWTVITFPSWSNQFHQPWIKGYMGERFWSTGTWTYFSHMWIDADMREQ